MPRRDDSEAQLNYDYTVFIRFDASGAGRVVATKRKQFEKYYLNDSGIHHFKQGT